MKNEVIKLTNERLWKQILALLKKMGEPITRLSGIYDGSLTRLYFCRASGVWRRIDGSQFPTTLTDVDFLQKYGENTEPEADKERELLEAFCAKYGIDRRGSLVSDFLSSLRKPAFELITADNVKVTDPEQMVWMISSCLKQIAAKHGTNIQCFATESAAIEYRLHNTPAIKLSDMKDEPNYYWIAKEDAHNLVNERINGK